MRKGIERMQNALDIITDKDTTSPCPDHLFTHHAVESNLRQSRIGDNAMLQAAAPIINYVTALCRDNRSTLRKGEVNHCLVNEIRYFTQQLEPHYRHEIILAARHILCSWGHEVIANSSWGKKKKWSTPAALQDSHPETWEGENFFVIIQRSASNPKEHQDLLQLCYCCMTLGYAGTYRKEKQGHIACYTIIDKLWELISSDVQSARHLTPVRTAIVNTHQPKLVWGSLLLITLCSIAAMFILEFRLLQVTKPMISYLESRIQAESPSPTQTLD
jgi:type IV/VI secretion system ImpK/VasF family protein